MIPSAAATKTNNSYIAIGTSGSPYVHAYPWSNGFLTKTSNPSTAMPAGWSYTTSWHTSGDYFLASSLASPYVQSYNWRNGFGSKLADPSVGISATPTWELYTWSNGFGTKKSSPSGISGIGYGAAWKSDNSYIVLTTGSTPYVHAYQFDESATGSGQANFGTKSNNPSTTPTGSAYGPVFSKNEDYLVVPHLSSPYITAYNFSNGQFGSKLNNPSSSLANNGVSVAFTASNSHIAIAHDSSPYITCYQWSNGFGAKVTQPGTLPTGNGNRIAFSPYENHVAVAHPNSPYVTIYNWTGTSFGSKINDPATLVGSEASGLWFKDSTK